MNAIIVVDVEMCLVQKGFEWKNFPYNHEIIQIGAVRLDEDYNMAGEFSSFVMPKYGKIDYFIRNLTGISERDILEAPSLEAVLSDMLSWIGDDVPSFYAWSKTDYTQISREIRAKGLDEEKMAVFLDKDRWVDYQKTAGQRFGKPWRLALEDALMLAEVDLEGKQHDALVDARNTARMIAKMQQHPDSRFLQDRMEENRSGKPLGTSLADALKGIGALKD